MTAAQAQDAGASQSRDVPLPAVSGDGAASQTADPQTAVAPPSSLIRGSSSKKPSFARKIFKGIDKQVQNAVAFVAGDATLPPDVDDSASWPFMPDRRAQPLYRIVWNDGQVSSIIPRTDGGFSIVGGDAGGTNLMPVSGGFAIMGRGGDYGMMTREPGGGFRIMSADGSLTSIAPRAGGGYYLSNGQGELGTIVPGPGGSRYGFGAEKNFFSFQIP